MILRDESKENPPLHINHHGNLRGAPNATPPQEIVPYGNESLIRDYFLVWGGIGGVPLDCHETRSPFQNRHHHQGTTASHSKP